MQVSFPYPVKIRANRPRLDGLRFQPFTNIDGESFGKPALNGFWRIDMSVIAYDMQSHLALSSFITQMSAAAATCVIPVWPQWLPNDASGRMMKREHVAPAYTFDHVGFANEPFGGFTLRAAATRRDSYIDVDKPAMSQLWPGHFITLDDRLYQVVNTTAIGESDAAIRVSVMPNIRGDHAAGKVVIVDQLRLKCMMDKGDQIGGDIEPAQFRDLTFIEAF